MTLLGPDGKKKSTACPKCNASKDKRENAAGFGPPVWICGICGYEFAKEDE